jgi:2',3'-cyclic-nucleotide 2'-phosphodiesterase (5'-nucleotidase family)
LSPTKTPIDSGPNRRNNTFANPTGKNPPKFPLILKNSAVPQGAGGLKIRNAAGQGDNGIPMPGKSRVFACLPGILLLLLPILILLSVPVNGAEAIRIQIFHTSDIHAALADDSAESRSMAQVAGVLQELRRRYGRENTLYIDTGDTVQGSIEGTLSRGMAPLEALRLMECDVWVPGNHEFDFGAFRFLELAESMRDLLLSCNLQIRLPKIPEYPSYRIFERGGLRIAVIGASASYMEHWFLPEVNRIATAGPALEALRRIMPAVRAARPHAIILAIHQGWLGRNDVRGVNEVGKIALEFPDIDLILGGHTHRAIPGTALPGGVWYVQPPAHGTFIGHITLECDPDNRNNPVIQSRLVPVTEDAAPDAAVAAAIRPWQLKAAEYGETVVAPPPGYNIFPRNKNGGDNPVSTLLCAAIAAASGADAALHGTLSNAGFKADKPITRKDIYAVVPYENTIVTCEMTADELAEVNAEQWTLRKSYSYCQIYGIRAAISKDGKVTLHDFPETRQRIKVAMNSHTAAGSGRTPLLRKILARPETKMTDTGISTRLALEKYLIDGKKQ